MRWHGSHSLDFHDAARQNHYCAAHHYVQDDRVAPLPADLHRWWGAALGRALPHYHYGCPAVPPHPVQHPLQAANIPYAAATRTTLTVLAASGNANPKTATAPKIRDPQNSDLGTRRCSGRRRGEGKTAPHIAHPHRLEPVAASGATVPSARVSLQGFARIFGQTR